MAEFKWDDYPELDKNTNSFNWDQFRELPSQESVIDTAKSFGREQVKALPAYGAMGGGIAGAASPIPFGSIVGAGVGAGLGKSVQNLINTYVDPEQAPQSDTEYFTDPLKATKEGIEGGVLGEGAANAIGMTGKALAPVVGPPIKKAYDFGKNTAGKVSDYILTKMGKIGHALPENYSKEYLKRGGKLNARPVDEIMEELQVLHNEARLGHEAAEKEVLSAKEKVRESLDAMRNRQKQFEDQLADQKFQTGMQLGEARSQYSQAAQTQKEGLQAQNVRNLSNPIVDAIKSLKDKVIEDSTNSYEILGNAHGNVSITPLISKLKEGMQSLVLGKGTLTGTDAAAYKELEQLVERINEVGPMVTYPEAKFILQRLGEDTKYSPNAGAFAEVANRVKQNARTVLDQLVKTNVPAYRDKMLQVEKNTKLLKELSKRFGTPELAASRLENIASVKGQGADTNFLRDLGTEVGSDFATPLKEHVNTRNILTTPSRLKQMQESLPQYARQQATQAELKRLSDPKVRRQIMERVKASQEGKLLEESKNALNSKRNDSEMAAKNFQPYKPFSQGTVQAKVKALTGARDFSPVKLFKAIDEASGKNFSGEIKDRAILDAFQKTDTNGARKTLVGKAIGKGLGMMVGGAAGGIAAGEKGGMIGASIGFSLDKYSGQVIKSLMDGKIKVSSGIQLLENKFGSYAPQLAEAAAKGPEALSILGATLSQQEDFRKLVGLD